MLEILNLGPLQTNCYIYIVAGEAMVIDAAAEPEVILETLRRHEAQVRCLVNTHAHFDHIQALAEMVKATGLPVLLHEADIPLMQGGGLWPIGEPASNLPHGFPDWMVPPPLEPFPCQPLHDGDELVIGGESFSVIHTPGHTPGSICLYNASAKVLFSGDTLFRLGTGRVDLPGGDGRTLLRSIKQRLYTLPDDTKVYPGHGQSTTIAWEKVRNPFVRPE